MYGTLVPSSGGRSLPLRKTRIYLGRAQGSDGPLSRENSLCQLEFVEGFWQLEDLRTPNGVKVNGRTCKQSRLMPDDEITIGKHRYRIEFEAPKYSGVGRLAKAYRSPAHRSAGRTAIMQTPTNPAAGGVLARMVPVGGGREIALTKPSVTIGRKLPCDVVLEYRSISSMHCALDLMKGYWQARDLNSRNGIRVDGVPVKQAWILPKSRLSLAEHRFQLDYDSVGPPPAECLGQREEATAADKRSLMDKLGISDTDIDDVTEDRRAAAAAKRRWNILDND